MTPNASREEKADRAKKVLEAVREIPEDQRWGMVMFAIELLSGQVNAIEQKINTLLEQGQ